jgi:DNA polymerase-4
VAAVDTVVPVRQVLSIDEMDCELTGRWQERERAISLARKVKETLRESIGECLRTSIGIGPNTFIAKTASDMMKPDGLVVIEKHELPQRLFGLKLRDLSGIGKQMEARLHRHGIRTIEELCARTRDELRYVWGGVGGEVMYERLRGEAVAARESATQSISHSSVLAPDRRNPADAFAIIDRLVQKAAVRLRKSGHYASRLSIGIKYLDGSRWDADMRLVDTQDTMTFLHTLEKLWTGRPQDRRTILQVGMAFSDLVSEAGHTGSLFAAESKSKNLYATLDKLNARFGKQAVYFASAHKARDRGGMHIAFNHIPDPETER